MEQSRPWSPTRMRLKTRDRRAKVRSISRWHLRVFFCTFFGDICVCASLSGLTYLQWLSLVLVCDTIAVPFSVGSLWKRHDGLSVCWVQMTEIIPTTNPDFPLLVLFCAFKGVLGLMEEKEGGRVVEDARSGFMEHTLMPICSCVAALLWAYCCTNERLIKSIGCALRPALFSVRCGVIFPRRRRFDYYRRFLHIGSVSDVWIAWLVDGGAIYGVCVSYDRSNQVD